MALRSNQNKDFSEKSFFNYLEDPDGKFRPGALVRVVDCWIVPYGTIGLFIKKARKKIGREQCFLVLIGEEKISFAGFEIELL